MKLASLRQGGRDGTLIVVSEDLAHAVNVEGIVPTLQEALENWRAVAPELDQVYGMLCAGEARDAFALDKNALAAPLPRAYQWLDGSAYSHHVELMRMSRGADMPKDFLSDPLMYQGVSAPLLGPFDDIAVADAAAGIDFEGETAVITTDVPMGVSADKAEAYIALVVLVNDISLRYPAMTDISKGFGFLHSKPPCSLSPVAVTLDTLGNAWRDGLVHLPLLTYYNGKAFGRPNAGVGTVFNFPDLIAHAAKTRPLVAGTIIGLGTVSNKDPSVGSSCILEQRIMEKLETGQAVTYFMAYGDTLRIEMLSEAGQSIFGAIEQKIATY